MPSHNGKEITLLHLAAQDSGLPLNADGLSVNDWKERYDAYTAAQMYEFLSYCTLTNDVGTKFQYSKIGMSLLVHVMELKSGHELRIVGCRPDVPSAAHGQHWRRAYTQTESLLGDRS